MRHLPVQMTQAVDFAHVQGRNRLGVLQEVAYEARYHKLLKQGLSAHPPPAALYGKLGRPKQSVARNLLLRLQELGEQRKDLLERNRELQERCTFVLEKKRQALEKMPHLLWGQGGTVPPGDPGFSHYGMFTEMLEETIHRTALARETLKGIHARLETLEI